MNRLFLSHNVQPGDTIDVEISADTLLKTLRSVGASQVKIHLKSSKSNICHFRVTSMQKVEAGYFPVTHEIPVQITHRSNHIEPTIDDSDTVLLAISDVMPTLYRLSNRYRFLDPLVTLEGNRSGVFRLHSRSQLGNVTSAWTNITRIMLNSDDSENATYQASDEFLSVTIKAKDWWNVLQLSMVARKVVVCLRDQASLYVYCFLDPNMQSEEGTFSYYITHVCER